MKEITQKLRDDALKSFIPALEQMAQEGATKEQILDAYKKYQDTKIKQFYKKPDFTGLDIIFKDLAIENPDSKAEYIFYHLLTARGINCKFHYKIGPYTADYLLKDDIVVELDGPQHDKKKDMKKDRYLKNMGYKVIRIPIWVLASDPTAVVSVIEEL